MRRPDVVPGKYHQYGANQYPPRGVPPSILFFNLSNIGGLELLDLIKRFLEVPKSLISHVQ